jgi:hypothetical protein
MEAKKTGLIVIVAMLVFAFVAIPRGPREVQDPQQNCNYEDGRNYVSKNIERCARIKIDCAEDFSIFSDECGCGCE